MLVTVLLLTALAVAVPLLLYRVSLSRREAAELRTSKPPSTDTPPSSSDATADPADAAGTQVAIRGDQQTSETPAVTQRPASAVLPPDETTDITPHERRMLDSMNSAASEQFEYIRQSTTPI